MVCSLREHGFNFSDEGRRNGGNELDIEGEGNGDRREKASRRSHSVERDRSGGRRG